MAHMIPNNTHNMTPGEAKLHGIFKDGFPSKCIVRYEVLIGYQSRRPDFTVLDPERGVCVCEIKDWGIDSIARMTPDQVLVRGMGGAPAPIPLINPNLKCQIYVGELSEMLMGMASLRDAKNHLLVNVGYFLIFPNIKRSDFLSHKLDQVTNLEKIIFSDDLPNNGESFLKKYQSAFEVLSESLTQQQLNDITSVIDPTIVLPRPLTVNGLISQEQGQVTQNFQPTAMLSLEQEEIAKSLGEGPRLLRGIAGTGKTMILLYRAKLLAANNEDMKILILCWNTALATYMRQAYDGFPISAKGRVDIRHFSEFVREVLSLNFDPFKSEAEDNHLLINRLNNFISTEESKYDAIYIDEAQDFRKEWIEFLFGKMTRGTDPKDRNFIIAADDAQRIYRKRDFSWDNLGFKFNGRSKVLKTIFRNSKYVWIFSAFLLEEKAAYVKEADKLAFANQGEYEPHLVECRNLDEQIEKTVEIVKNLIAQGHAARNVLILYRHKTIPWLNHYPLVENLIARFAQEKIPFDWLTQDNESKRSFEWEENSVKISTVHSAKGMDSPVVLILGVETYQSPRITFEQDIDEVKLLYVAMTRAREFLAILYSGKNGLVPNLLNCAKNYEEYRPAIINLSSDPHSY